MINYFIHFHVMYLLFICLLLLYFIAVCYQMLKESEENALSRRRKRAVDEVQSAQDVERELQERFKLVKENWVSNQSNSLKL